MFRNAYSYQRQIRPDVIQPIPFIRGYDYPIAIGIGPAPLCGFHVMQMFKGVWSQSSYKPDTYTEKGSTFKTLSSTSITSKNAPEPSRSLHHTLRKRPSCPFRRQYVVLLPVVQTIFTRVFSLPNFHRYPLKNHVPVVIFCIKGL